MEINILSKIKNLFTEIVSLLNTHNLIPENLKEEVDNKVSQISEGLLQLENNYNNEIDEADKTKEVAEERNKDIKEITAELKNLWQNDMQQNIILARRGLDFINSEDMSEVDLLNKMVSLGQLLSEDSSLKNAGSNSLSKTEARKQRDSLSGNKEFLKSIYNKSDASHQMNLNKLNKLNAIIAEHK